MITEDSTQRHPSRRFSDSAIQRRHQLLTSGYGRHQLLLNSSRFIKAQMRNRVELMRLDERRQALDREQREATAIIDRHKRKFVEQMANVTVTTSDLSATAVCGQRAATARRDASTYCIGPAGTVSARRRMKSYEKDDVSPALAALHLHDRNVEHSRRQPATTGDVNRMTETVDGSRLAAAAGTSLHHRRVFPDFRNCPTSRTAAARVSQSAKGRSSVAGEDAGQMPA